MAQAPRVDAGFLETYGIPDANAEVIKRARGQAMIEQLAGQAQNNRGAAMLGAILGQAVFGGPELTEDEQRKIAIKETADARMNEFQQNGGWDTLPEEEKQFIYQEELARAAIQAGDYETGSQMLQDLFMQRNMWEQQQEELEKLRVGNDETVANTENIEARTEGEEANTDLTREKIKGEKDDRVQSAFERSIARKEEARKAREEWTNYVVPTAPGQFNFNEPNIVLGRVNDAGQIVDQNGQVFPGALTYDQFDKLGKLQKERMQGRGTGKGSDTWDGQTWLQKFKGFVGDWKEQQQFAGNLIKQGRISAEMLNLMAEQAESGGNPSAIIDGAGFFTAAINNISKAVGAVGETAFITKIDDEKSSLNGKATTRDNLAAYAKENDLYDGIQLPPALEGAGQKADQYRAQIVELAYAVARANEPGARQLSDTDFRNALQEIGAKSADPQVVRAIVEKKMLASLQTFNREVQNTRDRAEAFIGIDQDAARRAGFSPERAAEMLYGKTNMTEVASIYESVADASQRLGMALEGLPQSSTISEQQDTAGIPERAMDGGNPTQIDLPAVGESFKLEDGTEVFISNQ